MEMICKVYYKQRWSVGELISRVIDILEEEVQQDIHILYKNPILLINLNDGKPS